MTVSELDNDSALVVLFELNYGDDYINRDLDDEDEEIWEELPWSLNGEYNVETRKYDRGSKWNRGMEVSCVEDFGGEGQGDRRWIVFKFADSSGTKYFRKDGYYASYDGTTWDGQFREVTPVERTVTFYE